MKLKPEEFIRRFLIHTLPDGFHRIRHFGFMANRHRTAKLALCRSVLNHEQTAPNLGRGSCLSRLWWRHAHHRALSTQLQPLQPSNITVPMRHIVSQVMPCTIIARHFAPSVDHHGRCRIRAATQRNNSRSPQQTINRDRLRSAPGHKLSPMRKRPSPAAGI
jgi:hypothetical protein